jgi:hypothetical protein
VVGALEVRWGCTMLACTPASFRAVSEVRTQVRAMHESAHVVVALGLR